MSALPKGLSPSQDNVNDNGLLQVVNLKKYFPYLLAGIILLASLLRLWGISSLDVQHDHAINSFRALGWLDYLVGEGQTSPIIWFGTIPWWS